MGTCTVYVLHATFESFFLKASHRVSNITTVQTQSLCLSLLFSGSKKRNVKERERESERAVKKRDKMMGDWGDVVMSAFSCSHSGLL